MPVRRSGARARRCTYPQSHALAGDIKDALDAVAANRNHCARFYLDTIESMSHGGEDHHQGLARTHRLSDGTVWFFLSHSGVDSGHGSLSQYRYSGPLDQEHVLETSPLTVAPMEQLLKLDERHPSDIAFLPDVNGLDAGYLFVTEEYDNRRLTVYRWQTGHDLVVQGHLFAGFPSGGPQFVFVDRVDNHFYLGVASEHRARDLEIGRVPSEKHAVHERRVGRPRLGGRFRVGETRGPAQVVEILDAQHGLDPRSDHGVGRDDEDLRPIDRPIIRALTRMGDISVLLNTPDGGVAVPARMRLNDRCNRHAGLPAADGRV